MKYIITIDGGTTNTRALLWDDKGNVLREEKREIGVRNTAIDGNNLKLKNAVKECLEELLKYQNISFDDIKTIIASGMISSNVGLIEIPHLVAPVGIEDFISNIKGILIDEICPIPIYFIPGVKNYKNEEVNLENFEKMDIMRGEEIEAFAVLEDFEEEELILVLPGSHTKFISVNKEKKITGCLTSITGELLSVITNHTILADAVKHSFVEKETYDKEFLLLGYNTAKKTGLGRSCFSGRILNQFITKDTSKIANFLLGVTLQTDMLAIENSVAIKSSKNSTIVVAGKEPLKTALVDILEKEGKFKKVISYELKNKNASLSAMGAYKIANQIN